VSGVAALETDPEVSAEQRARLRPFILSQREIVVRNLRLLRESGVQVVLASDAGERDVVDEALFVHELDVWPTTELLRILVESTPRSIFPERRIGRLEDGYEASFLVLGGNPLEDFGRITDIRLRVKDGRLLALPETPPDAP
jgi:imidazolonepropionase-like amidohydrolase